MSANPTYYTLIAKCDIPELGVSDGDAVTYEPEAEFEIGLHRPLECSRETIAMLLRCGAFKVACDRYPVDEVLSCLRGGSIDTTTVRARRVRGHLALVEEVLCQQEASV